MVHEYVREGPDSVAKAEKEHVMVAIHVRVDGRVGVLLADPGYHVPRIITVMADGAYPHTDWFRLTSESNCCKEYKYTYNIQNSSYVEWHEKETRGDEVKRVTSLVYIARNYLGAVNLTERRNLVYNFRSLISRDQKGNLIAGIYFPVGSRTKEAQFTIFYDAGTEKRKIKYLFSNFFDRKKIPDSIVDEVNFCNAKMNYKKGALLTTICKLAKIMSNEQFITQVLEINEQISQMSLNL